MLPLPLTPADKPLDKSAALKGCGVPPPFRAPPLRAPPLRAPPRRGGAAELGVRGALLPKSAGLCPGCLGGRRKAKLSHLPPLFNRSEAALPPLLSPPVNPGSERLAGAPYGVWGGAPCRETVKTVGGRAVAPLSGNFYNFLELLNREIQDHIKKNTYFKIYQKSGKL
jgi:hypothetical protein